MKQSGPLNPSEETGTGCPVTSKYGRTPPHKHGSVGRQQHIITIQETKIIPKSNIPKVHNFTTVRADMLHKAGSGHITLIEATLRSLQQTYLRP